MTAPVELHIATNATDLAPSTLMVEVCYESFTRLLGRLHPTVWLDPHPCRDRAEEYAGRLRSLGWAVFMTGSLHQSQRSAIEHATAPFLFFLEHDWLFVGNIAHTIDQILQAMDAAKLNYLRLNQRANRVKATDRWLKPREALGVPYLLTPSLSNNPHILRVETYRRYLAAGWLDRKFRGGFEQALPGHRGIVGAIYGAIGDPPAVWHINGRRDR
jgi:hypothetical protein